MSDSFPLERALELRILPDWLKEDSNGPTISHDSFEDPGRYPGNDDFTERRSGRQGKDNRRDNRRDRSPAPRRDGSPRGFSDRKPQRDRNSAPGGNRRPASAAVPGSSVPPSRDSKDAQRRDTSADRRGTQPGRSGDPRRQRHGRNGEPAGPPRPARPPVDPAPVDVAFEPPRDLARGVMRQIKTTSLACPLFQVARMFLDDPGRHRVKLTAREGKLYRAKGGGPVTTNAERLGRPLFDARGEEFFGRKVETLEEIKGNFGSVARCPLSGKLLGPSSHHEFQNILRKLYTERFARRMSFEDYRAKIETITDPEVIDRWKQEARQRETWYLKPVSARVHQSKSLHEPSHDPSVTEPAPSILAEENAVQPDEATEQSPHAGNAAPSAESDTPPAEAPAAEAIVEVPTPVETQAALPDESLDSHDSSLSSDEPTETTADAAATANDNPAGLSDTTVVDAPLVDPSAELQPAATAEHAPDEVAQNPPDEPTEAEPAVTFSSEDAAYHYFQSEILPSLIEEHSQLEVPAADIEKGADPGLREAVRIARETEMRFPQNFGRAIATIASKNGLHIFKHEKRFVHISAIRPVSLRTNDERLSPRVRKVAELLRGKVGCTRPKLYELVLRDRNADLSESAREMLKAELAADLRWLIDAGHVLEFANGTLFLVEPRDKREPSTGKNPAPRKAATVGEQTSAPAAAAGPATPRNGLGHALSSPMEPAHGESAPALQARASGVHDARIVESHDKIPTEAPAGTPDPEPAFALI